MTVSSVNFADLGALQAAETGTDQARLPWSTPIKVFQTPQGSLNRFSFHEPGDLRAAAPMPASCWHPSSRARISRSRRCRTFGSSNTPSRLFRVSITGELVFEINVPARHGRALWEAGRQDDICTYVAEKKRQIDALRQDPLEALDATLSTMTSPPFCRISRFMSLPLLP